MDARSLKDSLARRTMFFLCACIVSIAFLMIYGLYHRSLPVLRASGLRDVLFSATWHPTQGHFGLAGFIVGTLWVTGIAIAIAVPLSVLTAIYLSEYAPKILKKFVDPVIDLLAGISPVVFGVWGMVAVVPVVRDYLMPFFSERLPFFPFRSDNYTGFSVLSGGIVLAVMVFPIIISIAGEVLNAVPKELREASLALGATRWQTTKWTVMKKARAGIAAAVILGLSRAFGETMAVLMVAGCDLHGFPASIFDTAYPLPAFIANTYGEMMSIPLYDSAVLLAALILMVTTAVFTMVGWGGLTWTRER